MIRDVLGVTSHPSDQFPADDSGYGFDNIGEVLTLSPLHFERFMAAVRSVAAEATGSGLPPRAGIEHKGDTLPLVAGTPERRGKIVILGTTQDEVRTHVRVPVYSVYRIVVRAASCKLADGTQVPLELRCDGKPIATLKPNVEWKCWQWRIQISGFCKSFGHQRPFYTSRSTEATILR